MLNLKSVIEVIKKLVAAAPLIAVICVLIGIRIPTSWAPTFDLIAKANAGVAVLAAGLTLSTVKFSIDKEVIWNTFFRLFLTPAIIVAAAYLCGMGGRSTEDFNAVFSYGVTSCIFRYHHCQSLQHLC